MQHIKEVPVGKRYAFQVPIIITNNFDLLISYTLRLTTPSRVDLIPDDVFSKTPSTKWVWFEINTLQPILMKRC